MNTKHTATECRQLQKLGFYDKSNNGKRVKLIITKMETTTLTLAFNSLKSQIIMIFAGLPSTSNKRSGKLALWDIMAREPSTLRYLNWSEHLIQFSRKH
jgi:hypothetical protein